MIDHEKTRHQNKEDRKAFLLRKGCCPVCEIKLTSKYHTDCPYLIHREEIVDI